eukprot:Skav217621  [mRNA]  locus=scaffold2172:602847:607198:+ [translate_table: standard]
MLLSQARRIRSHLQIFAVQMGIMAEAMDDRGRILDFLSQAQEEWIETLKIAKAVGREHKRDVNPALYALKSQGQVLQDDGGRPRWKIAGRGPVDPKDTLQGAAEPVVLEAGDDASSGYAPTRVTPVTQATPAKPVTPVTPEPAAPPETACTATVSDEASAQPVYDLQVGHHTFVGPLESTKGAAQKSAAEKAMAYFSEHPDQVVMARAFEVSATNQKNSSSLAAPLSAVQGGRKKIDAEHFAAQAVLEELHSQAG